MNKIYLLKLWKRTLKLYPDSKRREDIERIIELIEKDM